MDFKLVALVKSGATTSDVQSLNVAYKSIEKIQSSINSAIPLWESQMVIAIQLLRQKGALAIQRGVANTTNNLIAKNSEKLIKTLEGIRTIRAEGHQNRLKATQELGQIQSRLNEQLMLQSSY